MFKSGFEKAAKEYWSGEITEHSHAMDLEPGVFTKGKPKAIAESVMQSAKSSHDLKSTPFRSSMSMINFYINRAGKNLPSVRKKKLEQAKAALRKLHVREEQNKKVTHELQAGIDLKGKHDRSGPHS